MSVPEKAADVLVHSQSIGSLGTGGERATEGEATKSIVNIRSSKVVVVLGTIEAVLIHKRNWHFQPVC